MIAPFDMPVAKTRLASTLADRGQVVEYRAR